MLDAMDSDRQCVCGGEHFAIANDEVAREGIVTSKDKQE
jgi:hypothetical protein